MITIFGRCAHQNVKNILIQEPFSHLLPTFLDHNDLFQITLIICDFTSSSVKHARCDHVMTSEYRDHSFDLWEKELTGCQWWILSVCQFQLVWKNSHHNDLSLLLRKVSTNIFSLGCLGRIIKEKIHHIQRNGYMNDIG